ncbi:MAG: hypothetical protein COV67_02530 [Nitrospinae bacterium CG11_big_fil_rev_8_21_14_0_20_56_8]|nr:MAG: hypothetical protein COV67_02530 [Nitrospinae bacterium CG11_big_fil_rev_8_21_14_0_20_56_8]
MSAEVTLNLVSSGYLGRTLRSPVPSQDVNRAPPGDKPSSPQVQKPSSSNEDGESLNESYNRAIDYQFVPETNQMIVKVIDKGTGEVVRQIPSEELMQLANRISDFTHHFFEETA